MTCFRIRQLLEEFALGKLDETEREQVTQHLEVCPHCRLLAEHYENVAADLPLALAAAAPRRPPESLKRQVLEAAQAQVQGQQNATDFSHPVPAPVPTRPTNHPVPANRANQLRAVRALLLRNSWLTLALAAAAVLVLAFAAFSLVSGWLLQEAISREQAMREEFRQLQQQQEMAFRVVNSNQTNELVLGPAHAGVSGYGKALINPDQKTVLVTVDKLKRPPVGEAYHVWVVYDELVELAGTLGVNAHGFGVLLFQVEKQGRPIKGIQVTLQSPSSVLPSASLVLSWEALLDPTVSVPFSPREILIEQMIR